MMHGFFRVWLNNSARLAAWKLLFFGVIPAYREPEWAAGLRELVDDFDNEVLPALERALGALQARRGEIIDITEAP